MRLANQEMEALSEDFETHPSASPNPAVASVPSPELMKELDAYKPIVVLLLRELHVSLATGEYLLSEWLTCLRVAA